MRFSIVTGCLLLVTYAAALSVDQQEWHSFKALFGKTYSNPQEENFRMKVYLENKKRIEEHNRAHENGKVTYTMKMNHFGDLLSHEFLEIMSGLKKPAVTKLQQYYVPSNGTLPDSVDWRTKGAVTPVKDQGQCGSCWAFSTTGALEGQIFLKKGKSVSLSEQNLVDCSWEYGNQGCNGGWMEQTFEYIRDNHGIDTEESYPYEATDQSCRFNNNTIGGTDNGFVRIAENNEEALKDAVANVGPIAVAIEFDGLFQFYHQGIYNEPLRVNEWDLNHAVLVVGYGTDESREEFKDYWLVKNSWGTDWGHKGYFLISRNLDNYLGVASLASYPIV